MRIILLSGMLAVSAAVYAQDAASMAAMQASQQAMQATMQANQQAMEAAQQANQQAMQNAQDTAQNPGPVICITSQPKFSVSAGRVAAGTLVRMKSPTHRATIYYTTDGWSPTVSSKRYIGPIRIEKDTVLQAIAVAPNMEESFIARANFMVSGSQPKAPPAPIATTGVLNAGTRLELSTAAAVNSKTAQVGDKLPLLLDQDISIGEKVIIPKGTTVDGLVTQADPAGHLGVAGEITFEVNSLVAQGITIPLHASKTLEGKNHVTRIRALFLIPVVGTASMLTRGDQAEITPGMTFNALVTADTPLAATVAVTSESR